MGTEREHRSLKLVAQVGLVLSLPGVLGVLSTGCAASENRAPRTATDRSSGDGATAGSSSYAPSQAGDTQLRDVHGAQIGLATWYGPGLAGHRTASGERFDPQAMTAAHLTLPLGTWVEVRRTDGVGPAVRVRINDRGPFGNSRRIIDLSKHAAQILGIVRRGTAEVSVRIVPGA